MKPFAHRQMANLANACNAQRRFTEQRFHHIKNPIWRFRNCVPLPVCSLMHDPSRADLSRIAQRLDSPAQIIADTQKKAFKSDMHRCACY
jgi:hypothetical protein